MKTFSIAGRALVGDGFTPATITITDTRIAAITSGIDAQADISTDGWIVPGFIDLQVNGAHGFDITTDPGSVSAIAELLPSTGVTAFLPTIISSPLEKYRDLPDEIQAAARSTHGAEILGVHLEGPYVNRARAGAHNPSLLRDPSPAEFDSYAGSSLVRLVTLAPELPGAIDLTRALCARGIVVSAGHSAATYNQAVAGFSAGITCGTHLYNAMSPFNHREPGLVGALLSNIVPCGLIVDGVHVHPAAVKAAHLAKGAHGIALVTDAMAAAGAGSGPYRLGDREVIVDENSARLGDGTLAGSILQMDQAIRNVIAFAGCSLAEAATMASATPARILGLGRKGLLAPGCDADLVVLDDNLETQITIARADIAYRR